MSDDGYNGFDTFKVLIKNDFVSGNEHTFGIVVGDCTGASALESALSDIKTQTVNDRLSTFKYPNNRQSAFDSLESRSLLSYEFFKLAFFLVSD